MTQTDEEKLEAILVQVEQLAKLIRSDQKRKKFLFGNYASRIVSIREMLEK